jgi:hypothetical protein
MTQTTPEALQLYDRFMAETGPDRLQKVLARYELFKMVMNVPGDIVECGVFKGSGIYAWAKFRQLFMPNNLRQIVGFDFFEAERTKDWQFALDAECVDFHAQGWSPRDLILKNLGSMGIGGVELIPGDVSKTTAQYARDNLGFRIALLYIDVDNYEGTLATLQNFYPLVCRGGIIALDEYALRGYGESDAVDEFFAERKVRLQSLPWANTPTAFVVKE